MIVGDGTPSRQIYKKMMYMFNMGEHVNIVKERAQRILKTDKAYRDEEVRYLRSVMKGMEQEELIRDIETLNYNELKAVVSCGVPGHAQPQALIRLKEKRDALDAWVSSGGVEATMNVEIDEDQKNGEDEDERICTSESRRESDSGTLDEESSAAGTS